MDAKNIPLPATRLLLPEYGRNVQKMVRFLRTVEDRELRNRQAEVVVGLMANLYPYKRDSQEFRNMLWDHLFMIAGFDLDVDAPFPKPTLEQFYPTPQRVPYPQGEVARKQYGRYAPKIAQTIAQTENSDPEDVHTVAVNLARFMRQKSYDYNNEYPDNQVVLKDLAHFSQGAIELEVDALDGMQLFKNRNNYRNNNNNNNGKKNNKNNQQNNQQNKQKKY